MVPSWCCIGRVRVLLYEVPPSKGCTPNQYQDFFIEIMVIDDPNDDDRTWMSEDSCIINISRVKKFSERLQPICVSQDTLKQQYSDEKSDLNKTYALFTWRDGEGGEPFLWQQEVILRDHDGKIHDHTDIRKYETLKFFHDATIHEVLLFNSSHFILT